MNFLKSKKSFGLILAVILSSSNSHAEGVAGVFVEPAVTYESGSTLIKYPAPFSESKEDVKGFGLGLRGGLHFYDVLFVALDGRYSRPTYNSAALGNSVNATAANLGLTLGGQTPFLGIRVWGTYVMDGFLNPDKINSVDIKFSGMNGYRVGAGVYFAMISVNLEYQDTKNSDVIVESLGPFTGGTLNSLEANQKSYIVSVSFPLAL